MEQIVANQRRYFNSNTTKPLDFRIEQLEKLKTILKTNEQALEEAVNLDYGKSKFETSLTEMYLVFDEINSSLENLREWAKPKAVPGQGLTAGAECYIMPEPLGVSLVIGPWNYPYQLALAPLVAAISAGCTAILKPSELTPHSSGLIAKLLNENFAPEYLKVVEGGIPETTELLAQKFDTIFFTGSVPVGKIVYQAAAKNLTPVTLELGGKSPSIFMPDCDLDVSVRRLVWGKFLNGGQTCIAPDYALVHKDIAPQFLEKVAETIRASDYKTENGNFVKIVNERNTSRIAALIDPEKVFLGGGVDIEKRLIEPTVLTNVNWEDKVMQEEIFGPLLPVLTFENLDDAILEVKERPKPLALYLFSEDEAVKQKVLSEISFGGGCVNDAILHISNGSLPFGGVGDSGIGRYHGEEGFRAFSHYKSIVETPTATDPAIRYSPYTDEKIALIKSLAP